MQISELTGEQQRQFIDTQQVFQTWRETRQDKAHRFAGSIRWAERNGFDSLFVDGQFVPVRQFRKLERFKEHTIDVVVGVIDKKRIAKARNLSQRALEIGRGTARLTDAKGRLTVMSTEMSCPGCGRAF